MAEIAKRNFTGGELAPSLHARADLSKFQTGLATLRNFTIHPQGGVSNRGGFQFLEPTKDHTKVSRLIPFEFNKDQAYILEFGDLYMRVMRNGGHVVEAADTITGATQADPVVLSVVNTLTNGDEIFVQGVVGMTEINARRFIVANVTGTTVELQGEDGTSHTAYVSGGTAARVFTLTTPYVTADIALLKFTQSADVMTITHPTYSPRDLARTAHDAWTLTIISYAPTINAPAGQVANAGGTGAGSNNKDYEYVVTAVDTSGQESVQSGPANETTLSLDGTHFITVGWNATPGADYYNIYKAESEVSDVYGWIGESKTLAFRDYNLLPDITDTPPLTRNPFPGADDFPGTVTYYQQRQVFGRTNNNIQTLFATQSGNFHSMNISRPTKSDDSIERTIASRTVNEIRHFVDLNALILLTSGGVWRVTEGEDGVLTPASVGFRTQTGSRGASHVPPVLIGDNAIYVQSGGRKVRDLGEGLQVGKYVGIDISLLAKHLFEGRTVKENAYAEDPDGIVWYVMSDGDLLGLTYLKEHDVFGWHRHDTDGNFESIATIPNGPTYEVYVIVNRTINGSTKRYIERLKDREFATAADAFILDSGLTYDSTPATTITGLDHLEGEVVVALADANVVRTNSDGGTLTVTNGQITLAEAASKVHIGLAYVSDIETLDVDPLDVGARLADVSRGKPLTIAELIVKVKDSRGGAAGPTLSDLEDFPAREIADDYDSLDLESTEHRIYLRPQWTSNGHIFIRQADPLPLTILAIVPDVDVG